MNKDIKWDKFNLSFYAGQCIMDIILKCPNNKSRQEVSETFLTNKKYPIANIISISDIEN